MSCPINAHMSGRVRNAAPRHMRAINLMVNRIPLGLRLRLDLLPQVTAALALQRTAKRDVRLFGGRNLAELVGG